MNEIQPPPGIDKEIIAVFDLDGTLTRFDTYLRYLMEWLVLHPERILRCWNLPIFSLLFFSGFRDNTWLKRRFLNAVLAGAPMEEIESLTKSFVSRFIKNGMRSGTMSALRTHQERGNQTILLSASLDIYVAEFANRLGFSRVICTKAKVSTENCLTGTIDGENCYGTEKLSALIAALGEKRPDYYIVAYADHYSDYPLMQWSDQRVLVNPSKKSLRLARDYLWEIVFW